MKTVIVIVLIIVLCAAWADYNTRKRNDRRIEKGLLFYNHSIDQLNDLERELDKWIYEYGDGQWYYDEDLTEPIWPGEKFEV